jgi:hypothetical protein
VVLEGIERGTASVIQRHYLPVNHCLIRHWLKGLRDGRILGAEVLAVAGAEVDLAAGLEGHGAIPIKFQFQ